MSREGDKLHNLLKATVNWTFLGGIVALKKGHWAGIFKAILLQNRWLSCGTALYTLTKPAQMELKTSALKLSWGFNVRRTCSNAHFINLFAQICNAT